MASLRSALRLAPRAQIARRTAISRLTTLERNNQRGYAAIAQRSATDSGSTKAVEQSSQDLSQLDDDPNMNGNYPDPSLTSSLPLKRQHRDPYGEWWDPIERRNYGEPVHEDNDILGIFTPDDYTHFTSGWEGVLWGCVIVTFAGFCTAIYQIYPDQPAVTRTFEGGLDRELGGSLAASARASEDEPAPLDRTTV